jgi:hypothetical protein
MSSVPLVTDADRIRALLATYGERLDAGDFDGVGALFADGRLAGPDGTAFASGAAEVAAFYRAGTQLHDGSPRTKHLVLNTAFDEPADAAGPVVVRSSYLVLQQVGDGPLAPIITGRYVDTVVPAGDGSGRWRFRERRFLVDLVGDLSRHLADPTVADISDPTVADVSAPGDAGGPAGPGGAR